MEFSVLRYPSNLIIAYLAKNMCENIFWNKSVTLVLNVCIIVDVMLLVQCAPNQNSFLCSPNVEWILLRGVNL